MPPEKGGQTQLAALQFNCGGKKGEGRVGGGERSCHGAQWVQSLWLECWKNWLVSVINGGELGVEGVGEAGLCNLNTQHYKY